MQSEKDSLDVVLDSVTQGFQTLTQNAKIVAKNMQDKLSHMKDTTDTMAPSSAWRTLQSGFWVATERAKQVANQFSEKVMEYDREHEVTKNVSSYFRSGVDKMSHYLYEDDGSNPVPISKPTTASYTPSTMVDDYSWKSEDEDITKPLYKHQNQD
jgi:hypothetical protein